MNNNFNSSNSIRKEIVDKADIVNIVSQYVKLEKRGNNYIGLCPFHDDKNPSMSVSPQKKVFKCFSCGVAGDVVSFVGRIKNISNSEALREVGETVGIKVAMSQKDILRQKNAKYYSVLSEASNFYHFYLTNTIEGKKGIDYLSSRKLTEIEIERFNIGLAGDNDILYKTLTEKKYLPLDMIEVGLIRGGDYYRDVFKNRIIFPLKDLDGNVVGFSGRRFLPNSDNESKYLNTNETILFKKGEILYNYSDCVNEIKSKNNVYLFEGFMDVIAAVRADVKNSVASMGTALTVNQINAIKRFTNNVTLCFDSDGPGVIATIKAIYLLVNANVNVNVALIPDGKDADEYIFNNEKDKLHQCLTNNIISAMDYLYKYEKRNSDFTNINSIESFKTNIFNHLSLFKSNILIEKVLRTLAEDLNVSFDSLALDFNKNKTMAISNEETKKESDRIAKKTIEKGNDRFKKSLVKYEKSERKLILACYNNQKDCFEIENMLENQYYDENNRNLLFKIFTYYKTHNIMDKRILFEDLTVDEQEVLQNIIDTELKPDNNEIKVLVGNIKIWAYQKYINYLSNKPEKNQEDLNLLTEYKKKITKLKNNKE